MRLPPTNVAPATHRESNGSRVSTVDVTTPKPGTVRHRLASFEQPRSAGKVVEEDKATSSSNNQSPRNFSKSVSEARRKWLEHDERAKRHSTSSIGQAAKAETRQDEERHNLKENKHPTTKETLETSHTPLDQREKALPAFPVLVAPSCESQDSSDGLWYATSAGIFSYDEYHDEIEQQGVFYRKIIKRTSEANRVPYSKVQPSSYLQFDATAAAASQNNMHQKKEAEAQSSSCQCIIL